MDDSAFIPHPGAMNPAGSRMALRDDLKERVQQATDIVRLIGEHVALKPKGREFVGLCPFHDDKSPSFYVNPAKQIYKCFPCGAGGDVFSFVMAYHKMTFPEAIRHLAERAGIPIEESHDHGDREGPSDRKRLAAANQQVLDFFRTLFKHAEHGKFVREYVESRGISAEMIADFQLGYAPDRWDGLATMIASKKWDLQAFEMAGLVKPRQNGQGHFDILRHRLIFPICDSLGRPIAFGGRKLRPEDEPKYLNSPETPLFNKSRTLYGLHLAKKPIIDSRTAVIVEGYVDVIACHQAGFRNVVATLGTALTAEHVAELRRYAEKVVLIFDADAAGERAADRAVELFLTGEVDVAIAELPHGPNGAKMDPGELLFLEEGPSLWLQAIERAQDALAYQFSRVRRRLDEAGTVTGRQRVAEEYLRQVGQLGLGRSGAIRRVLVIQRLAELLHMAEPDVDRLLKAATPTAADRLRRSGGPASASGEPPVGPASVESRPEAGENNVSADVAAPPVGPRLKAVHLAERQLIGCLLKDHGLFAEPLPNGRAMDEALPPESFKGQANRRLYGKLYERLSEGQPVSLSSLLAELASEHEAELAGVLVQADADVEQALKYRSDLTVGEVFRMAAQRVLGHESAEQFRQEKDAVLGEVREASGVGEADADDPAARALKWAQSRLAGTHSPVRIARLK